MNTELIGWKGKTWNPVTGCTKISEGCMHCYAERMAKRLCLMGQKKYSHGFAVTVHPESLNEPLQWKRPLSIFTCSMSDLFHEQVPDAFILQVFRVMNQAHWHTFQVLTKRAERLAQVAPKITWTRNIWMGVTVESQAQTKRIPYLASVNAAVRWLCIEPMVSAIPSLDLRAIHWVILGGESGPFARPLPEDWVVSVRDQCVANNVPFYFKQWGGANRKANGCTLQGRQWREFPYVL